MRNKTELEGRGALPSQKTASVLIIALPIVTLFVLVYAVDFCRYRRKKTISRQHRSEAGVKLRVRPGVVTNTYVTEETKPGGKNRKGTSYFPHVKHHRSDKNSAENPSKPSIFTLNIPVVISTTTAMAVNHGDVLDHVTKGDSHETVAAICQHSPVNENKAHKLGGDKCERTAISKSDCSRDNEPV